MNDIDIRLYRSFLEHLKKGLVITKSSLAREANIARGTVRNRIEKYTFQDLEKYRS